MRKTVNLQAFNTFGIEAYAQQLLCIKNKEEAIELFSSGNIDLKDLFILGGGSNILLTKDPEGVVVKNEIEGISLLNETSEDVLLKVGAGENWHAFVLYCVEHAYAGIENLSLIPGNVGASPMQNIGAYGVEVKDVIESVEAVSLATGELRTFTNAECQFDYRSSIFKTELKGQFLITAVSFRLYKKPDFKTSYGAIQQQLATMGIKEEQLSIKAVSDAVIAIRQSKLPDPAQLGNSGSFFKNPVVSESNYLSIKEEYNDLVAYPLANKQFKLAAGWLIEQAGWKGHREGNCGVHDKQALVLVNFGGATGKEIYALSEQIVQSVRKKFGVELEREVNIL
jgi:UDP-N-acetylmuramate dehydrogenase